MDGEQRVQEPSPTLTVFTFCFTRLGDTIPSTLISFGSLPSPSLGSTAGTPHPHPQNRLPTNTDKDQGRLLRKVLSSEPNQQASSWETLLGGQPSPQPGRPVDHLRPEAAVTDLGSAEGRSGPGPRRRRARTGTSLAESPTAPCPPL